MLGHFKRAKKHKPVAEALHRHSEMLALEPRIVFDCAAPATAAATGCTGHAHSHNCNGENANYATPDVIINPDPITNGGATPLSGGGPGGGYSPAQIEQAYGINAISFGSTAANGSGQTIAIIDAYYTSNIASWLATFDTEFGIAAPPSFSVVTETGSTDLTGVTTATGAEANWAIETALDVEWAHALAPDASIILVEANTNSYSDLLTGVDYAKAQTGVSVVSMSWGGAEFSGETYYDSTFTGTGVTFVASAGDTPAQEWPSESSDVVAVGGTQLSINGTTYNYVSESGWNDSGGGVSTQETEPTYQEGVQTTGYRTAPDVGFDASTGSTVSIYDGGWTAVGGTSVGAPCWSALVAIADQGCVLYSQPLYNSTTFLTALYNMPSTDFHNDIAINNGTGTSDLTDSETYNENVGLGTPIANLLIPALAGYSDATGANHTVSMNENASYTFTASDFGFSDNGGTNTFKAVDITTLPTAGSLTDNGVAVTTGEDISVSDITGDKLVFTPATGHYASPYSTFTFQVEDSNNVFDTTARTMTIDVAEVNHAPVGANHTATLLENGNYTFATANFGFSDPNDSPANSLQAVEITTLPGAGTLRDNGTAVTAGQLVSAADIAAGLLVYTSASNANGAPYSSFTFQVQDNGGTANGGVNLDQTPRTMTLDVTAVTQAPVAANNAVTILENGSYTFTAGVFGFSDPNNNPAYTLADVKITALPTVGSLTDNGVAVTLNQFVSIADINSGKLVYTPVTGGTGASYSTFDFKVESTGGTSNGGVNVSTSAYIITENITAVTQAPTDVNHTADISQNAPYAFQTSDFGFSDPDNSPANSFAGAEITTLPNSGKLTLSGVAVTAGEFVTAAEIAAGSLVFTPATNATGDFYFTFQDKSTGSTANGGVNLDPTPATMTISATAPTPTGSDSTITALENGSVPLNGTFGFGDGGGVNSFEGIRVVTTPGAGTLTLNGIAVTAGQDITAAQMSNGDLVFTPAAYASGNGYASFTDEVIDSGGNSSAAHTVTVNVTHVAQAPTGENNTETTNEATPYTFAAGDFGFSDPHDTNTFLAVKITTLPTGGTLTDNGVAVTAGQFVSVADITSGYLVYTPPAGGYGAGYGRFTFQVEDNGSTANGGVVVDPNPKTMAVNVIALGEGPSVSIPTAITFLNEATPLNINLSPAYGETLGSNFTISGIPVGATLMGPSGNITIVSGAATVPYSALGDLHLTPPTSFRGTFDLSVTAADTDVNNTTTSNTGGFSVVVQDVPLDIQPISLSSTPLSSTANKPVPNTDPHASTGMIDTSNDSLPVSTAALYQPAASVGADIINCQMTASQQATFQIPQSVFSTLNPNETITYETSKLPSWLTFNPVRRAFEGTPPANVSGEFDVKIIAHDGKHHRSEVIMHVRIDGHHHKLVDHHTAPAAPASPHAFNQPTPAVGAGFSNQLQQASFGQQMQQHALLNSLAALSTAA